MMLPPPSPFTPDELDEARSAEALRLWMASDRTETMARIAARLSREGWLPPPEPLTLEARKIAADGWEAAGFPNVAVKYRSGEYDGTQYLKDLTLALKRGMEIAHETPRPDRGSGDPDHRPGDDPAIRACGAHDALIAPTEVR